MAWLRCSTALVLLFVCVSAFHQINIDKYKTTINGATYNVDSSISGLYTIAEMNGVSGPLFHKYNLNEYHDLAKHKMIYNASISTVDLESYQNVNLVLEGVDTVADIYLNHTRIAKTNNMFVRYVIDIKKHINEYHQELSLVIHSPLNEAKARHGKMKYYMPQECPNAHYKGDCYVNLLRKLQASFSWDWGPTVPSMGIWKPAYIEAYNESVIRDVVYYVDQLHDDLWKIAIDVYFAANKKKHVQGHITHTFLGQNKISAVHIRPNEENEMIFSTEIFVESNKIKRWWPNGYGEQPLYDLMISFESQDKKEKSERTVRVGFRTIHLQQPAVKGGTAFYFEVNDVPIYLKGSNLIPIDIRPELGQDKEKVKKLFQVAKDQHMNVMRIWGGGVYESDYLYDLADEYGILIWQDFMFACSLYQSDQLFLNNVIEEAKYQIKRIGSHPSILLFSGNNENEGVLVDNWYHYAYENRETYYKDYRKLYVDTLREVYGNLTHHRGIYLISSPSNGAMSEKSEYGISDNPGDHLHGDVHIYDITNDPFDPSTYPIPRLTSEYGYQSMPSAEAILRDTDSKADCFWNSSFMLWRQHHPGIEEQGGQQAYYDLVAQNLEYPAADNKYFDEAFIYYSQITQAVAMKIQTQRYRNYRSIQLEDGRGLTMGALYWQLNDVWVTPSWSSIDYYGRWKMLQYYTYDFFAPILITGELTTVGNRRKLDVFVISDVDELKDAEAIIQIYKWTKIGDNFEEHLKVSLAKGSSKLIRTIDDVDAYLENARCNRFDCFIYLKLGKKDVQLSPDNWVLPEKPKNAHLPQPKVKISSIKRRPSDKKSFDIEVTSDMNALFVWLDAHRMDGRFSENGFLLVQKSKWVIFYSDVEVSEDHLKGNLTVTHLRDPKYFPD